MIKQGIGFALLGAVIAILGHSATGSAGYSAYVSGGSFYGPDTTLGPWVQPVVAAAVGAVVGMIAGLVLHLCGFRFTVEPTRRVGLVVVSGLVGVTLGMTPVLVLIGTTFSSLGPNESVAVSPDSWLLLYTLTGVLAYVLAVVLVRLMLKLTRDPWSIRTTKFVAIFIPPGGVLATLVGVGTAWILGFSTTVSTFVAVIVAVLCVLAVTFALARARALSMPS